jgi:PAS domain S-box-containing protein
MSASLFSSTDAAWSSAFVASSTLELADYQRLLGLVAQAVWETDANGYVVVDSPSWRAYTGQSLEAWLGEGWIGAIHPDDQAYALAQWQEAVQKRQTVHAEFRLQSPDGGWRWTNVKAMPVLQPDGSIQRWLGINIDIHDKKQAQAALGQQQQYYARELETDLQERTAQLQANQQLLQATLDASQDLIQVFQAVRDQQGAIIDFSWRLNNRAAERHYGDVIGQRLLTANPGVVETGIFDTFKQVVETGVPDQSERHYVHEQFAGWFYQSVVRLGDGVATTTADITPRKQAEERLRASEQQFRRLTDALPQAIWVTDADGNVTFLNQWWSDYSGIPFVPTTAWQIAVDILHPEDGPRVAAAFREAMQQGRGFEIEQRNRSASGEYRWFLNRAVPYPDPNTGQITQWVGCGVDVHDRKLAEQALQESEVRFRRLIEEAPVATCLFVGRQLRIEDANPAMIQVWGKGPDVIGLPLAEALPELKQQHFLTTLDKLFTTGDTYQARGGRADLVIEGQWQTFYFDYDFKPLRNAKGVVYAILETATDVTQQVLARQQIDSLQVHLQEAIELAQLGIWSIDVATGELTFSDRLIEWFGYDPEAQPYTQAIPILEAEDQERVNRAVAWALNPQSDGVYNEIYTVIHPETGQKRILHARGKTVFDAADKALRLNGTAQDITLQREMQVALEQQVQQRTEELAAANEELVATNEELAANNEEYAVLNVELEEANVLLIRSNENLQTFAYVASHDLQEPLRKIQQFGDLLKTRYAGSVGEELVYIERMQSAAKRMSLLIKDLLDFSRISTQRDASGPISLQTVVKDVLSTLELDVEELGAQIRVVPLPTVTGDGSQLGQLFQNLLSNALKFHRPGLAPVIDLEARLLPVDQLPPGVKPSRGAVAYHQIAVIDNGIGFDEKYAERIFQVFQRLHGKSEYAGTGIGLAICEKVVANHGGAITATSQPGQGATFTIYLPA